MLGSSRLVANYEPGQTVDDFDLLLLLGRGAFASVFLARQRSLHRLVALKISAHEGIEPQALAQLEHPHIVRVFDQRILPYTRLLYMQYVAGGTLHDALGRMRRIRPLRRRTGQQLLDAIAGAMHDRGEHVPTSELQGALSSIPWSIVVARIGSQVASALDFAHRQGVSHRDIKPANILLDANGTALLVDFNTSFSSELQRMHAKFLFGGSVAYMSPEHLRAFQEHTAANADAVTAQSDIYSLGIVLYEMLVGFRPLEEQATTGDWNDLLSMYVAQRSRPFPSAVWTPLARYSALLRDTVRRCLEPDPLDRFQSANSVRRSLQAAAEPVSAAWLDSRGGTARGLILSFPVLSVYAAVIAFNAAAAWFVFNYNLIESVRPAGQASFWKVQAAINSIAFPVALALVFFWTRAIARPLLSITARTGARDARGEIYPLVPGSCGRLATCADWPNAWLLFARSSGASPACYTRSF